MIFSNRSLLIRAMLATLVLFSSCARQGTRAPTSTGFVPDDPDRVAAIPMIVSSEFLVTGTTTDLNPLATASLGGKGGGKGGKTVTDTTSPTVSILSPAAGSTVSGTVSVQVGASDNVGVTSVSLAVDGVVLGTLSSAPYAFSWTSPGDGATHALVATAKDAAGNSRSASIQVQASSPVASPVPDTTPPTVQITSPANGATVSGMVSITVSALDNDRVASVRILVDGMDRGGLTTAPYVFTWDSATVAAGTHSLTAQAFDNAGNMSSHGIVVTKQDPIVVLPPGSTLSASYRIVMPPVRNQGGEGACAVFATAYAARSAELFYRNADAFYSDATNVMSPEFVYDQVKTSDCGSGAGLTTSLDFMASKGAITWQSMPYSSSNGCAVVPTADQWTAALANRITGYSKMASSDQVAIKSMVAKNHPVIIILATDESFWDATPGFIWKQYSGPIGISHAIVISGYDDAKHAYQVMNSWGTDWGDAGYGWIDYDFFPQATAYYVYAITN
jgi:hypothetical protein